MRIITTHMGTDFDALASVVACTFLYPGSAGLIPSMLNPEVKQFLAIHSDILRIQPRKGFDLDGVTSLVVVDANSWKRLDQMDSLAKNNGLEVICWDHHLEGVTIESSETHREEVGATVTLLLEEMRNRDTPISPMHATLFLLGIYSDTGCLRYPSVTPRDAAMVGFLIENGADLNVVSAYLDDSMDDAHTQVFGKMLDESEVVTIGDVRVGICALHIPGSLTSLPTLVEKYREFKGMDAAFGIFQAESGKCMVIGRGKPRFIDIGHIMRELGGGGHPGAGSAILKGTSLEEAAGRIQTLIAQGSHGEAVVQAVMSDPAKYSLDADATMAQACQTLAERNIPGLLVCEQRVLLGGLSVLDCAKAEKGGRSHMSVKAYANRAIPRLDPRTSCREAVSLMADAKEGVLAVVANDTLIGVVTKADLLFQVYQF